MVVPDARGSTTINGAPKHTGHTARASGACHLAAAGVDLWRVQIFGRWSSAAFLRYIRSSPLLSLKDLASETALAESIAAAKSELRALTNSQIPVMLDDADPEPAPQTSATEYVCNSAAGGKVHVVSTRGDQFHPRHWRSKCGWYFGRGLTNYSIHAKIPSGKPCKVCMPEHRQAQESSMSSSESSSSSA
eukprot:s2314_g5.t1